MEHRVTQTDVSVDRNEVEIDLKELFYRLLDKWVLIVLCTVIGGAIALAYTLFFVTPKYESTAKIYVLSSSDSVVNLSDLQLGTYLASDYKEVFSTREVNEQAIQELDLPYTYEQMLGIVKITNPTGTRILEITANTESPKLSADIANTLSSIASDYIATVMLTDRPTVLSVAVPPAAPSSPSKAKNTFIGAVAGCMAVVAWITIALLLDNRIKSADELTRFTGLPVFAQIPETDMKARRNLLRENEAASMQDKQKGGVNVRGGEKA